MPVRWKKVALCLLLAAVPPAAFALALSLLPQAETPLWLMGLSALCGGGIGAWLCFAPKEIRREKGFRLWGGRLCALLCIALLCALGVELFGCNHRAFVTRNCQPEELSLYDFLDSDEQFVADENGEIPLSESGSTTVFTEGFSEPTAALGLRFRSDPMEYNGIVKPVGFTVYLRDDASYYASVEANSGVYIPYENGLDEWYGAFYSNGDLSRLEITLSSTAKDQPAYLTQVTLNPQVPVTWRALRVAVSALALWLVLCMCRFPWRRVRYVPGKTSHRLVLLLPMVLLLAFQGSMLVLSQERDGDDPLRGMFHSKAFAELEATDHYIDLLQAFLQGRTALLKEPSPELLALQNPYDISERLASTDFLFDYAMYDGHYYIYFGPGPVLLFYLPYYLLTGQVPSRCLYGLLVVCLSAALIYFAITSFARKYAGKANLFLLSLACFTTVFVAGWPYLFLKMVVHQMVISLNIAMMAGALGFGFSACMQKRRGRRVRQFLLCGLCFAFQATCRANTLLLTTAFLAPSFVEVLTEKGPAWKSKLRDGLCFLVPALIGVGFVMWYNLDRFGSVAEFGQNHQLTFEDIHYNVFRLEYIPQALYYFFLNPPEFLAEFPYARIVGRFVNVTGNFFFSEAILGALSYPLLWSLPLAGVALRRKTPLERADAGRTVSVLAPLLIAAGLAVVSYFFAGISARYTLDFQFALALCAVLVWLRLCDGEEHPAVSRAFALCCVLSVLLSVAIGFDGTIENNSRGLYYTLARMFFPY